MDDTKLPFVGMHIQCGRLLITSGYVLTSWFLMFLRCTGAITIYGIAGMDAQIVFEKDVLLHGQHFSLLLAHSVFLNSVPLRLGSAVWHCTLSRLSLLHKLPVIRL